jgi:hypothetical protein
LFIGKGETICSGLESSREPKQRAPARFPARPANLWKVSGWQCDCSTDAQQAGVPPNLPSDNPRFGCR